MQSEAIDSMSEQVVGVVTRRRFGVRAAAVSVVGFTLDFYDLYVVVFVAPVIATAFFPVHERTLSLAGAYSTLAVTLIMRPIGAALIGRVADRRGRKRAMLIGLTGVGVVTAAMGALPTYPRIGLLAPVLLLLLRLAQGLFVGGVFASTLTLAPESVTPRWRGAVSGLVGGGGTAAGSVLASLALVAATHAFPGGGFAAGGWRFMFFAGGLPVLLGVLVARFVEESPLWRRAGPEAGGVSPLRRVVAPPYRRVLAANVGVVFGAGTQFLLTLGFLPTYLQEVDRLPAATVGPLLVVVNLLALACAPLSGHLSQRFGRRGVLLTTSAVNAVALPLLYLWLGGMAGRPVPTIGVPVLLISALTIACFGPLPIFLAERFPTPVRGCGTALSINIGFALAGLVPTAVNAASGRVSHLPVAVVGGLVLASVVGLSTLIRTGEPPRGLEPEPAGARTGDGVRAGDVARPRPQPGPVRAPVTGDRAPAAHDGTTV